MFSILLYAIKVRREQVFGNEIYTLLVSHLSHLGLSKVPPKDPSMAHIGSRPDWRAVTLRFYRDPFLNTLLTLVREVGLHIEVNPATVFSRTTKKFIVTHKGGSLMSRSISSISYGIHEGCGGSTQRFWSTGDRYICDKCEAVLGVDHIQLYRHADVPCDFTARNRALGFGRAFEDHMVRYRK